MYFMRKLRTCMFGVLTALAIPFIGNSMECRAEVLTNEEVLEIYEIPEDISLERQEILRVALSLYGKIDYEWGGKAKHAGWHEEWEEEGEGLDCSGYVDWVYWTAFGERIKGISSTGNISYNCREISKEELLPGDLGLFFCGGSNETATNHVGIYLGNEAWIHCASGKANTVIISEPYKFQYFVRIDFDETTPEEYAAMLLQQERERMMQEAVKEIQEKESERLKFIEKGVSDLKGAYEGMMDMEEYIMKLMKRIEVHVVAGQEKTSLFGVALEGTATEVVIQDRLQAEDRMEEDIRNITAQGYRLQNGDGYFEAE